MQTDLVGLSRMPREVQSPWPLFPEADAVLPPKSGDEVATGVTNCRYPKLLDQFDDVFTKPLRIRTGVAWFVQTIVNAPTEMFHKRTEQSAVDRSNGELGIDSEIGRAK